jgi:hypothetical protein
MGGSAHSQLVGAADYGSFFSAFAGRLAVMISKSSSRVSGSKVACLRAMPNPSINRTCPGKPGHAGYLKRWASR